MATNRHQPITRTIAIVDQMGDLPFDPWNEGRWAEISFEMDLSLGSASTVEAFRPIYRFWRCVLSEEKNFDLQIYAKPSKSKQRGQDLEVFLIGGYIFDILLDVLYDKIDKDFLKLKLEMTAVKFGKEQEKNVTFISKEMVATLSTGYIPNPDPDEPDEGYKFYFEDTYLGTLTEPYLELVDGGSHSWKFKVDLIVDEKDAYGVKLPKLESIEKAILEEELHTDFVLVAGDGGKIPCSKDRLSSRSKVFCGMLKSGMKESTENECKLEGMSKEGVKALLKYIYYFSVEDALQDPKIAMELLEAGHKYDVILLEDAMKRIFIGKPEEWFTVDAALLLFLWSLKMGNCKDLTRKAVMMINMKWDEARKTSVFQEQFAGIPKNLEKLHSWTLRAMNMNH
ncbi:unnamed protein product [Orchesella dallaii]|uniref:BTB domain-containing protein n=1 Tax=Orchesella dallaii TaxID=48710 RepID=A0ABP1QLZ9_9HEXA